MTLNDFAVHYLSNAPWSPTGYGNQTQVFLPRLKALGVQMSMTAFYGLQGAPLRFADIPVLPGGRNPYGNDVILADFEHSKADALITLMDVWVLAPEVTGAVPWCPWFPVDHDPVPPGVLDALQTAFQPIAMSKFGQRVLKEAGVEAAYVPHGIDVSVFKPVEDRMAVRRTKGFPEDAFLVGIVCANKGAPSRKAFDQQIRAFAEFQRRHEDAALYMHTDMLGAQGINLRRLIDLSGIPPRCVIEVPPYNYARGLIDWQWMAEMYSSLDVLMNATKGEGFGIPIIEAQACGTPVIVTDFSAMPELVRAGWTVGWSDKFYSQESYQVTPSVPDMVQALEEAYAKRGDVEFRQQARAGVVKDYDADYVTETHWKPVLENIAERLGKQQAATTDRRARLTNQRRALRAEKTGGCAHDFSKVGVWVNSGRRFPCRKRGCDAARSEYTDGRPEEVVAGVFSNTINGVTLDVKDDPAGGIAKIVMAEIAHDYDLDSIPFNDGDVVLDVGAQVGVVSCYLAKKHPNIRIIALEPVPSNFKRLKRNLKANHISNVTPVNKALTGDGRMLTIRGNTQHNTGGLSAFTTPNGGQEWAVESVTLADVLRDYNVKQVKLLKLDAEGAEYEILQGAGELLTKVDYLRGEFHTNSKLRAAGYTIEQLTALVGAALGPERVKISPCRIAE